ncbi:MAG: hypothetical protein IPM16_14920 [Chloroflexi bacterium]|nr:hypothetical protein [Chloroflexota bacterium]
MFVGWGAAGVVTPGDSNNVRAEPTTSGALVGKISPSDPFRVMYQSATCADGYLWIEIQTMTLRGWTVERSLDGGEPFLMAFAPEPVEVGERAEDGTIRVEAGGVAFTVPAGLGIERITMTPEIGLFGDVMSAQPSSLVFEFYQPDIDRVRGSIEIYPYEIIDAVYELYRYSELETLLTEQPNLLDYAARNRMPQLPLAGAAALFGGAGAYLTGADGIGMRFLTYFAQDWVLFDQDDSFEYLYRGFTTDRNFFVTAQDFWANPPAGTIPTNGSRADELYPRYLRQLEANLAAQPASAFTPDLALLDSIFTSFTVTDIDALLTVIP